MCVIAVVPKGILIPSFSMLKKAWSSNPDGAGFMYPDITTGKLVVVKGLMSFTKFKETFKEHSEKFSHREGTTPPIASVDLCIHFRIRSHGTLDAAMTHPHWITPDGLAIAHNGIIRGLRHSVTDSDTVVFIDDLLRKLPRGWYNNPAIRDLLKDRIGQANKIVIFDKAGHVATLWETSGTWDAGVWWSNSHHLAIRYTPQKYTTPSYWDHDEGWDDCSPCVTRLSPPSSRALTVPKKTEVETKKVGSDVRIERKPFGRKATITGAKLSDDDDEEMVITMITEGDSYDLKVTLGQAHAFATQIKEGKIACECMPNTGVTFGTVIRKLQERIEAKDAAKAGSNAK